MHVYSLPAVHPSSSVMLFMFRIERLAVDICEDLDFQPVTVVCVLKGGFRFCADLSEQLQAIGRKSNRSIQIVFDFIRLRSYQVHFSL